MKIFENYNTAKQKYGKELVDMMCQVGIPPQYLLSACRFSKEGPKPEDLKCYFKQWMTYVIKNNRHIDVNNLSFDEFYNTIQQFKSKYENNGKIYDDGIVSVIPISTYQQMSELPFRNFWCIRKNKYWDEYREDGAKFYLIINDNYSYDSNCQYVMLEICSNGEGIYWSTDNEIIDKEGSSNRLPPLEVYQQTLGSALQKIKTIQGDTLKQTENNQQIKENKTMNKKQTIRLNESQLKNMVIEAVKRVLMESKGAYGDLPSNERGYRRQKDYDSSHNVDTVQDFGWGVYDRIGELSPYAHRQETHSARRNIGGIKKWYLDRIFDIMSTEGRLSKRADDLEKKYKEKYGEDLWDGVSPYYFDDEKID